MRLPPRIYLPRTVSTWEKPRPLAVLFAVILLATVALGANIALTAVTPSTPEAAVEFDFEYVEGGTEVTVTLTENGNDRPVVVRAGADSEGWVDGTGSNAGEAGSGSNVGYDDWDAGATLSEPGDSTTNLLTRGSGDVSVYGVVGALGRQEVLMGTRTYRVP